MAATTTRRSRTASDLRTPQIVRGLFGCWCVGLVALAALFLARLVRRGIPRAGSLFERGCRQEVLKLPPHDLQKGGGGAPRGADLLACAPSLIALPAMLAPFLLD